MKPPICIDCEHNETCNAPCPSLNALRDQYMAMRDSERREFIEKNRHALSVLDAEIAPDIEAIAKEVIATHNDLAIIPALNVRVGFVRSFERKQSKGRIIFGDCRKVTTVYGAYVPYDFIVTLYALNTNILNDEQIKILLWHELKHIKLGDRGLMLAPHDVEEFDEIILQHGVHWEGHDTTTDDAEGE